MNRKGYVYYDNIECGIIEETDQDYIYTYNENYLLNNNSKPISLTLPLQKESFHSKILFPFFDGIIPEGWILELSLKKWKLDKRDRMGILLSVCQDVIGAVSVFGDKS